MHGTPNWYAPEIVQNVFYAKEVDIWSFGCFAYELATGGPPYMELMSKNVSLFAAISDLDREVPSINEVETSHRVWDPLFKDFVKNCLIKDRERRSTIE